MSKNTITKTLADARTLWLAAPHPKREGASNASRQANDLKNHDRALACLAAAAGDGEEALGKLPITLLQRDPNLLGRQVREGARILAVRQDKTVASDKTLSNQVSCVRAVQKTVYQDLPQRRSVHDVIATRPSQRKNRPAFSSRDWPESLSTDWAGFKVWKMAGILPLAEQPYRKQPSRESSFKSYLCKLNQYVGFLVREQGRTDLRLEDLCDADTYVAFLNWYLGDNANTGYAGAKEAGVTLATTSRYLVAKGRLEETTADGTKVWQPFYKLAKHALEMGAERGRLTPKKDIGDWKPWHLTELGEAIWNSEPVHKSRLHNPRHLAQLVCRKRTALFFLLARETPLRIRNWSDMRWRENLHRTQDGRWAVRFSGNELKVGRRGVKANVYEHVYSAEAGRWIERWRDELRGWLGDDFETLCPYVLPPSNFASHRCNEQNLSCQIKGLCEEILGKTFHPHMVRYIVASHIVNEQGPGGIKLAALLLGDTEAIVLETYYRPNTDEAMQAYLATCAANEGSGRT